MLSRWPVVDLNLSLCRILFYTILIFSSFIHSFPCMFLSISHSTKSCSCVLLRSVEAHVSISIPYFKVIILSFRFGLFVPFWFLAFVCLSQIQESTFYTMNAEEQQMEALPVKTWYANGGPLSSKGAKNEVNRASFFLTFVGAVLSWIPSFMDSFSLNVLRAILCPFCSVSSSFVSLFHVLYFTNLQKSNRYTR